MATENVYQISIVHRFNITVVPKGENGEHTFVVVADSKTGKVKVLKSILTDFAPEGHSPSIDFGPG